MKWRGRAQGRAGPRTVRGSIGGGTAAKRQVFPQLVMTIRRVSASVTTFHSMTLAVAEEVVSVFDGYRRLSDCRR